MHAQDSGSPSWLPFTAVPVIVVVGATIAAGLAFGDRMLTPPTSAPEIAAAASTPAPKGEVVKRRTAIARDSLTPLQRKDVDAAPRCDELWKAGRTIPADYAKSGCVTAKRDAFLVSTIDCLALFESGDDTLWGRPGGKVQPEPAPDDLEALAAKHC